MTGYPFSAVAGQEETRLALLLAAVNPSIGGVLLRGQKGTAKSTIVRGLARLLPTGPLRTLSLGATEDRVAGGLDLEASIVSGRPVCSPGLLAEADGGVLNVDEVNLLDDHLVDLVLDAAASGRCIVEREGVSSSHPSRFILVGTMNPEEGELRPQLLDRFGLCVEVAGETDLAVRTTILRRRLAFDADPAGFSGAWSQEEDRLAARLADARLRLATTSVPEPLLDMVVALAVKAHVAGHRADLVMAESARAHAAWSGRTEATEEDVGAVAQMVLRHRRRETRAQNRPPRTGPDERTPSSPRGTPGASPDRSPMGGPGPDGASREQDMPTRRDDRHCQDRHCQDRSGGEEVSPIGQAFHVRPIEPDRDRRTRSGSGRRLTSHSEDHRGHCSGSRQTDLADDLAIDATLRAAALHQRARHQQARRSDDDLPAIIVTRQDWRRKVRVHRVGSCVVLVVDASGSMGAQGRMIASKGAVMSLLLDAYTRRDQVALIAFRRRTAETLVPLTPSVEVARRGLAELPVGGRTPLSAGLAGADRLLRPVLLKEPTTRPVVILVTDGRGNVTLAGEPSRTATEEALALAGRLAADRRISWVVIDTADHRNPTGSARNGLSSAAELARALGASCLRIKDLRAEDLIGASRLASTSTSPRSRP